MASSWGISWGISWANAWGSTEAALLANDVTSPSSVTTPALHQAHVLLANDISSATVVSNPLCGHILPGGILAEDVISATSVTVPTLGQTHVLAANDNVSGSSVSTPGLQQLQALLANDIVSGSAVSQPLAGIEGEVEPEPPEAQGGGTTSGYRKRRYERRGVIMGRKEYEEILALLVAKAAKKTAKIAEVKRVAPTQKSIIAVTEDVTAAEAERLQAIWRETAASLAELDAIDTRYWTMANALAGHFARQAQIEDMLRRAREDEQDDEDVLLLAG